MRDFLEIAGMLFFATVAAVLGLATMVCVIAAPFVAIGAGIAVGAKIIMWAIGWPS
jgi:hypothetical protein